MKTTDYLNAAIYASILIHFAIFLYFCGNLKESNNSVLNYV